MQAPAKSEAPKVNNDEVKVSVHDMNTDLEGQVSRYLEVSRPERNVDSHRNGVVADALGAKGIT